MGENECERGGGKQRRARRAYGKIKETPGVEVASEHAGNEQGERELGRQGAHEGPQDEILVPERSTLFQHLCKCVGACAVVHVRKTLTKKWWPRTKRRTMRTPAIGAPKAAEKPAAIPHAMNSSLS